jgi:hypothetical protein
MLDKARMSSKARFLEGIGNISPIYNIHDTCKSLGSYVDAHVAIAPSPAAA